MIWDSKIYEKLQVAPLEKRYFRDILIKLDKVAYETNYSRNELINLILKHGLENIEIIFNRLYK